MSHKLFLGVFILLTLPRAATAAVCSDLFKEWHHPSQLRVASSTEDHLSVPLFRAITPNNVDLIFTHNYERANRLQFGAKAVVLARPGQAVEVYFFKTGEGTQSWNIHHVGAISAALNDPREQMYYILLPQLQGYELTAKMINGQWAIVRLDISSTLTYLHEAQPHRRPPREQEAAMLEALLSRIDESLQKFPKVDLDDLYERKDFTSTTSRNRPNR